MGFEQCNDNGIASWQWVENARYVEAKYQENQQSRFLQESATPANYKQEHQARTHDEASEQCHGRYSKKAAPRGTRPRKGGLWLGGRGNSPYSNSALHLRVALKRAEFWDAICGGHPSAWKRPHFAVGCACHPSFLTRFAAELLYSMTFGVRRKSASGLPDDLLSLSWLACGESRVALDRQPNRLNSLDHFV